MSPLKRMCRSLTVVALVASVTAQLAHADGDGPVLAAAQGAIQIELSVDARFEATSRYVGTVQQQDLPYVSQPFADLTERLLRLANIEATGALEDDPEPVRLSIRAHGVAEAALYDTSVGGVRIRETIYRAANLAGSITLETAAGSLQRNFEGDIPQPFAFMKTFGYDPYRDPSNAPFRQAFEAPGGFAEAIARLVGDIYGRAVLEGALGHNDPLVRRAAELALSTEP